MVFDPTLLRQSKKMLEELQRYGVQPSAEEFAQRAMLRWQIERQEACSPDPTPLIERLRAAADALYEAGPHPIYSSGVSLYREAADALEAQASLSETERCAKIAEDWPAPGGHGVFIAAAIRSKPMTVSALRPEKEIADKVMDDIGEGDWRNWASACWRRDRISAALTARTREVVEVCAKLADEYRDIKLNTDLQTEPILWLDGAEHAGKDIAAAIRASIAALEEEKP